jgi:hypothetical protein
MEERKNSVQDAIDFSTTVLSISGMKRNKMVLPTQAAQQLLRTDSPGTLRMSGKVVRASLQQNPCGIVRMYYRAPAWKHRHSRFFMSQIPGRLSAEFMPPRWSAYGQGMRRCA